jgi:hypothetical protein
MSADLPYSWLRLATIEAAYGAVRRGRNTRQGVGHETVAALHGLGLAGGHHIPGRRYGHGGLLWRLKELPDYSQLQDYSRR